MCTPVFIAPLFTIVKTRKQPQRPSADAWIKTMWHLYTMDCFSAIKKKEALPLAATWMDLEMITLSEVGQMKKYDTTYMWKTKININISVYKTQIDSQIQKTNPWLRKGERKGGETDEEYGVNQIHTEVMGCLSKLFPAGVFCTSPCLNT